MKKIKMNEGKKFRISFGRINKYYILPFLTPVVSMIRNCFVYVINKTNKELKLDIVYLILSSLEFMATGFILYLISYYSSEKKKKMIYIKSLNGKGSTDAQLSSFIVQDVTLEPKQKIKFYIIITIMTISPLLNFPSGFFIHDPAILENRFYCFLFMPFLSKLILGIQIYRHHIFSLILSFIGYIIFASLFFYQVDFVFWVNLRYIFACSVFSLYLVLMKYLSIKYYFFSPGKIYISIGIIMLILILIGSIIYSLIDKGDLSFFQESFDFSNNQLGIMFYIYLVIIFILHIMYNILTYSVIFYFDPNHFIITDIFKPFLFWMFKLVYESFEEETYSYVTKAVGYTIQLLSALICNEIIIFHCCKLGDETVKGLLAKLIYDTDNLKSLEYEKKDIDNETTIEMEGGYDLSVGGTENQSVLGLSKIRENTS